MSCRTVLKPPRSSAESAAGRKSGGGKKGRRRAAPQRPVAAHRHASTPPHRHAHQPTATVPAYPTTILAQKASLAAATDLPVKPKHPPHPPTRQVILRQVPQPVQLVCPHPDAKHGVGAQLAALGGGRGCAHGRFTHTAGQGRGEVGAGRRAAGRARRAGNAQGGGRQERHGRAEWRRNATNMHHPRNATRRRRERARRCGAADGRAGRQAGRQRRDALRSASSLPAGGCAAARSSGAGGQLPCFHAAQLSSQRTRWRMAAANWGPLSGVASSSAYTLARRSCREERTGRKEGRKETRKTGRKGSGQF